MRAPCYSARFIQPFAAVLANCDRFDPGSLAKLRSIDPMGRIPIDTAHELVVDQVTQSGDPDLGIKAARTAGFGRAGPLDYAMNSAATVRKAIELGARYSRLFSDSLKLSFDLQGAAAVVRLGTTHPAPRAVPDFAMAYWYMNHTRTPLGEAPPIECFFEHRISLSSSDEYDRTYGKAKLTFGAPFYGFAFAREYLDAPLGTSDPSVHGLLCEYLTVLTARLDTPVDMVRRVRDIVMKDFLEGAPTIAGVAGELRMSPRTLTARLAREGSTFRGIVDSVRCELALRYVHRPELSHAEVAFRLGFSHVEAFYRAFKRWTGLTPLAYRKVSKNGEPPRVAFPDRYDAE
jgi:AraC-like DNA-binding protein